MPDYSAVNVGGLNPIGSLMCVRCLINGKTETFAYVTFDGFSLCKDHFFEVDEMVKKYKQQKESLIVKPGG